MPLHTILINKIQQDSVKSTVVCKEEKLRVKTFLSRYLFREMCTTLEVANFFYSAFGSLRVLGVVSLSVATQIKPRHTHV